MASKFFDRVRVSILNTAGTSDLTLGVAAVGARSFTAAGALDGDQVPYLLEDISGSGQPLGTAWEIGVGTFHNSGTFSRDTVTCSSSGTTRISATSSAVLNCVIRGEDISGLQPVTPSAPTIVQSGYTLVKTTGTITVNLAAPCAAGNLLAIIGFGGEVPPTVGFNADEVQPWSAPGSSSPSWNVWYGLRAARSGDQNITVAIADASSDLVAAVVVELAGVDYSKPIRSQRGIVTIGGGGLDLSILAPPASLVLGFTGGDSGASGNQTNVINQGANGGVVQLGSQTPSNGYATMHGTNSTGNAQIALLSFGGK
jgi:hypothetical protein